MKNPVVEKNTFQNQLAPNLMSWGDNTASIALRSQAALSDLPELSSAGLQNFLVNQEGL